MLEEYKGIREDLLKAVVTEMVGPGSESKNSPKEYEIISESPLQRYSTGILYPQKQKMNFDDEIDNNGQNEAAVSEDNEHLDISSNTANQYYPSSMGMSIYVNGLNPELQVTVNAAKYRKPTLEECEVLVEPLSEGVLLSTVFKRCIIYEDNKMKAKVKFEREDRDSLIRLYDHEGYKAAVYQLYNIIHNGWIRVPLPKEDCKVSVPTIRSDSFSRWSEKVDEKLGIVCIRRPNPDQNHTLFTISLINWNISKKEKSPEEAFFQVGFSVEINSPEHDFLDYRSYNKFSDDPEEKSLFLLYRNKKTFAVGHGCAVSWQTENGKAVTVRTEIIPYTEVAQVKFDVMELKHVKEVLAMKNLSDISGLSHNQIIEKLRLFANAYIEWINGLRTEKNLLPADFRLTAESHIKLCEESATRILKGITELEKNNTVFKAFQLANRAMLMQRAHTLLQGETRYPDDGTVKWPEYQSIPDRDASWRPFQLAFILLNIVGIDKAEEPDRELVDLIWFPTGGGKTEAYLGLAAFTIFLRRLKNPLQGNGTAIIMRYTLRLLTAQQFQRAGTLICACELIRRENPKQLGDGRISIGLWIGSASTPNTLEDAFGQLDKLAKGTDDNNPFQVLSCPWCGTKLTKEKGRGEWGYLRKDRPKRFALRCTEKTCTFRDELPISVIDDDIYRDSPTLLFGTVDKFAMMPWKKEISNIFALDSGNNNLSPELIIQDELHLISGPLGTIVGLYETALDALCSQKGIKPKVIASTATIRKAADQVRALYNREVRQFPPSGLNAEDSFFARQASLLEKPGRLYAGILASGKTQTTTQVRLMSAQLQYLMELDYAEEVKDKYWTLVGYFNTIRELGKCSTLVEDDIKDQVRRIDMRRKTRKCRKFYEANELTSRKRAEEIPEILERLKVKYPDKKAIDILLATNMISVGVDVDRLGMMTVISQPKTTSEYIQATSRVGRKYPGLIFTLYDGARPRDRSHYERFTSYHEAFYQFVEPTSVTPFSGPARDRALHAVLVTFVRHLLGLNKDNQAVDFKADMVGLDKIIEQILSRVENVMREEKSETEVDLIKRIESWVQIAGVETKLTYGSQKEQHLLYQAGKKGKHWPTLQSMRNVDAVCNVFVKD